MTKKQLLSALVLSTVVLAQAGSVSADEITTTPVDATAPVIVTPTEPIVSEETPIVPPETDVIDETTQPTTEEVLPAEPIVPVDTTTTPETTEVTPTKPETSETGDVVPEAEHPSEATSDSTVTVPTTDGGTATVTPDKTIPTNNPNISAEAANNAGASQIGTTSEVTGQVVQHVSTDAPIYTNTGITIVSTQSGQLVLSDGSTVNPEAIGAITNADKTISVTQADGTQATLPETGEERGFLGLLGSLLLGSLGYYFRQKRLSKK